MSIANNNPQEYNNYKICGTGNDIYGKQRLELAVELRDNILTNIKQPWFIENGTLLGAWRNKKFIDHDDDFDYAILIEDELNTKETISNMYEYIKENLNKKYECRLISTYANKIEVYDPTFGKYLLAEQYGGADFHYVSIDLQFYKKINEYNYQSMYYINPDLMIDIRLIHPLRKIKLENYYFPAPFDTRTFLINHYGSLDENAKYNKETGKYHLLC